jgi:hypothetical protein
VVPRLAADWDDYGLIVGTLCSGGDGGSVYKLNRATGSVHWEFLLGESVIRVASGERVVILTDGGLYCIDRQSGQAKWMFSGEALSYWYATDTRVCVSGDSNFYVLSRSVGTVELAFDHDRVSRAYGDDALFVVTEDEVSAYPLSDDPDVFSRPSRIVAGPGGDDPTRLYAPPDRTIRERTTPDEDTTEVYNPNDDTGSDGASPSFCPTCGHGLREYGDIGFCPGCGGEVDAPVCIKYCSDCGSGVAEYGDISFCPDCGSELAL